MHKPIKADFANILSAVAMGSGKGKQTAKELAKITIKASTPEPRKKS